MDIKTAKDIKALADACRKAGIQTFKGYGVEFTLTDPPVSKYKRRKPAPKLTQEFDAEFETDSLTQDQLLMWSVGDGGAQDQGQI